MTARSWSHPSSRFKRAFGASLALLALAMATSVPTVHAWAHEGSSEDHHHSGLGLESSSHHDEHPSALHADWLVLRSVDLDASPALPCVSQEFVAAATTLRTPEAAPETRPLCSRPPAPNPARGPPIV